MRVVSVVIEDVTGAKRQRADIPDDIPLKRVITALITKMKLPSVSPSGSPLNYQLHHKASGRSLSESDTLANAGIRDGAVLKIHPVVVAGGNSRKY
jgi:uncharacterized ubiquitin-like protein YukD